MKWLILLSGIICNASASVLVKMAMTPPRKFPALNQPMDIFTNWPFCLGVVLYGAAFLFYAAALSRLPINVAHPILTAGAIAVVALASLTIFKEPFYWTTFLGVAFVIIGVLLITSRVS